MGKFVDLSGERFGKLVVLNPVKVQAKGRTITKWNCLCACGTHKVIVGTSLTRGLTKTCGVCKKNKDLTNEKFGKLLVLCKGTEEGIWNCLCDCGNQVQVQYKSLLYGNTKSCGCIKTELLTERNKNQLASHHLYGTRLYSIWDTMRARCIRLSSKDYKNYGARGIIVCEEWRNHFESFYHWAIQQGYEDHLTLDRIDVNGNYEPANCRWATIKEQANNTRVNRRITINCETKTIAEWAALAGISPKALRYRIESGWNEKDLLVPVGVQNVYITIGKETKTISEWAKEKGVSASMVSSRYKNGILGEDLFRKGIKINK